MKDQHEKIKGYRDLSQQEIDLMNEGKQLAERVGEYIERLHKIPAVHEAQTSEQTVIDKRWLSIGQTQLQQGFMAVIRSIARPTTF